MSQAPTLPLSNHGTGDFRGQRAKPRAAAADASARATADALRARARSDGAGPTAVGVMAMGAAKEGRERAGKHGSNGSKGLHEAERCTTFKKHVWDRGNRCDEATKFQTIVANSCKDFAYIHRKFVHNYRTTDQFFLLEKIEVHPRQG